jgi:hypothetical protein
MNPIRVAASASILRFPQLKARIPSSAKSMGFQGVIWQILEVNICSY